MEKKANDFEEEHGWCPDYGYEQIDPDKRMPNTDLTYREAVQIIKDALAAKPVGGKATYITADGVYEADHNYEPPKVKKIEWNEEDEGEE